VPCFSGRLRALDRGSAPPALDGLESGTVVSAGSDEAADEAHGGDSEEREASDEPEPNGEGGGDEDEEASSIGADPDRQHQEGDGREAELLSSLGFAVARECRGHDGHFPYANHGGHACHYGPKGC
jgi:hypothetical protein